MILERCKCHLCNISITISVSFFVAIILVIHVSYYIAIYLNVVVLFMVWTCVKGGDVRVSTGKCFIFVMKYIKLTYIQAGMMFISFLCLPLFNPSEKKRQRSEGGGACR